MKFEFKVGDKVKLAENSRYQNMNGQLLGVGVISSLPVDEYRFFKVSGDFKNDPKLTTQAYRGHDLQLVEPYVEETPVPDEKQYYAGDERVRVEGVEDEGTVDASTEVASWTQSHYDQIYKLKPHEIKSGEVRLDAYKVNKAWGLNSVDPTGAAFHCLKTLTRIPKNKNPLERELIALIGQIKGWAREEDVDLSKYLK